MDRSVRAVACLSLLSGHVNLSDDTRAFCRNFVGRVLRIMTQARVFAPLEDDSQKRWLKDGESENICDSMGTIVIVTVRKRFEMANEMRKLWFFNYNWDMNSLYFIQREKKCQRARS